MKKRIAALVLMGVMAFSMTACGDSSAEGTTSGSSETEAASDESSTEETASAEGMTGAISVISREDGSGTRGAFIELFGIEEENADGEKVDNTTADASVSNSTAVVMTNVAQDPQAIGYISLGSLDDSVKALKVDGAEASVENVKNDSYKISRPFNIATKDDVSEVAQDFIDYIMSAEGQQIVEESGYIAVDDAAEAYAGSKPSGKVVVAGSSSVTPVMEKLAEAFEAVNSNVTIEVQQSDSTTGVTATNDGLCDIGMASRDLKDDETSLGLTATVIATDGIAVIVNNDNPISNLTTDQVKSIYMGETTDWSEIQ